MQQPMPIQIRGVHYDSARHAAEALGVSRRTVLGAVSRGRQDFCGLGVGKPMRVTIRGVTYASVKEAAQAIGVAPSTAACGLSRGDPDRIGLGLDYRARRQRGGTPPKAVTICGQHFASIGDLARAIGRDPRAVRTSLRKGETARANLVRAVLRLIADRENAAMKAATALQQAA